ncbi:MAG TPA: hypothetical protein VEK08_04245 [Planctomycetota bacterium]|nr:hypothetical protein [Planctomycetota bacterium]
MKVERSVLTLLMFASLLVLGNVVRPHRATVNLDSFWSIKTQAPAVHSIVVAGDSRVMQGISPKAMEAAWPGQSVWNYGYNAACLNRFYVTSAAAKLDLKKKNPTLVLGVSPSSLTPHACMRSWHNVHSKITGFEAWWRVNLLPLSDFVKPYPLDEILRPWNYDIYLPQPDGWWAQYPRHERPLASHREYTENFKGNLPSPEIMAELFQAVRELTGRGIRVVTFRMPCHVALQRLEDEMSQWDEACVREKLREAGAVWLTFDPSKYRYYDGSHMAVEFAVRFSEDLARELQKLD